MTDSPIQIPALAIIDDAEFDQMMYRRIVERAGIVGKLYTYHSGEDALKFMRQPDAPKFDVILLDINMPGMSGLEFLEVMTQSAEPIAAEVVIIMLTTSLNPKDVARARSYEIVKDYLNKPLEAAHLPHIANLLRESRNAA